MKKKIFSAKPFLIALFFIITFSTTPAQFLDNFDNKSLTIDTTGLNSWTFRTGDGYAVMDFSQMHPGFAAINVDASKDQLGIWWAFIRRYISENMDISLLSKPKYELRVEAKIKVSSAPKRVNLHLNTHRTTNFHSQLMEFDIPDTVNWHTISMTTKDFDAVPGDSIFAQLAMIDWGLQKYHTDIDYLKVDIVNIDSAGPDKGVQVPYHPPVPPVNSFTNHIPVSQDAIIDINFTDTNFKNWSTDKGTVVLLTKAGLNMLS